MIIANVERDRTRDISFSTYHLIVHRGVTVTFVNQARAAKGSLS